MKEKDFASGHLFEGTKPEPGERGYLPPGWHFNSKNEIVDDKGNIRKETDAGLVIVKEAPSEGLKIALKAHGNIPGIEVHARRYQAEIDRRKREAESARRKTGLNN